VENMRAAIAALNAQLAETETPTRASGSNAGATPAEMDERAKAKQEEIEKARKARQEELDKANKDLAEKRTAAAPDQKALDEARAALKEKKAALRNVTKDPDASVADRAAAKKAVEEAQKGVETKADTPALRELAKFKGVADVASAALQQVSEMIPGGSLRVTSASSRFVTMRQDFNPPLVIGFHAFDREIRFSKEQGLHLGPPIATQQKLLDAKPPVITLDSNNSAQAKNLRGTVRKFHNREPEKIKALDAVRLKLYPASEALGFGTWLQSAPEAQVELFMRASDIPLPEATGTPERP